jgi:hypothetical protein
MVRGFLLSKGDEMDPDYVIVELKYCEGCGGLYLRLPVQPGPYCPECAKKFARFSRRAATPARGDA